MLSLNFNLKFFSLKKKKKIFQQIYFPLLADPLLTMLQTMVSSY